VAQRERLAAFAAPPTILPSPAELPKEGADQRQSEGAAIRRAEGMSRDLNVGAVAFKRSGDSVSSQ
jgi:hypothetical protein